MGKIKLYTLNKHSDHLLLNIKQTMSPKFSLNKYDYQSLKKRALLFLLPLAGLYFGDITAKIAIDGFQIHDFYLDQLEQGALILYVLNRVTHRIQLWLDGNKN